MVRRAIEEKEGQKVIKDYQVNKDQRVIKDYQVNKDQRVIRDYPVNKTKGDKDQQATAKG